MSKKSPNRSNRCVRCDGKTQDGSRCKRPASCRIQCNNLCWQHAETWKHGSGCSIAEAKKKKKAVQFRSKAEVRPLVRGSKELINRRKAYKQMDDAYNRLSATKHDCVQRILGRLDVWDKEDLAKVSGQDLRLAETCLKVMSGKKISNDDKELLAAEVLKMEERDAAYRKQRV